MLIMIVLIIREILMASEVIQHAVDSLVFVLFVQKGDTLTQWGLRR